MITITKKIEFDSGHRVTNHDSKCRFLHGHRYKLEATFGGEILGADNPAKEGMILDFGDIKRILQEVTDVYDHAFIVWVKDEVVYEFLRANQQKYVGVRVVPTVENIAQILWEDIAAKTRQTYNTTLKLKRLVLYETPNSFTEITV